MRETIGALDRAVRSGKALDAGIWSYPAQTTAQAANILRALGTTAAIVGASRPARIEDSVRALGNREFDGAELAEIDRLALDAGVDLWTRARRG